MQTKLCLQGIPWVDMEHGRTFNNYEILVEIRDKFKILSRGCGRCNGHCVTMLDCKSERVSFELSVARVIAWCSLVFLSLASPAPWGTTRIRNFSQVNLTNYWIYLL